MTPTERYKKFTVLWGAYKFRPGQYYDRVLYALLARVGLTLDQYYHEHRKEKQGDSCHTSEKQTS